MATMWRERDRDVDEDTWRWQYEVTYMRQLIDQIQAKLRDLREAEAESH